MSDRLRRLVRLRRVEELDRAGRAADLTRQAARAAGERDMAEAEAQRLIEETMPSVGASTTAADLAERHLDASAGLRAAVGSARRAAEAKRLSELGWEDAERATVERRKMTELHAKAKGTEHLERTRREGRMDDERATQKREGPWDKEGDDQ